MLKTLRLITHSIRYQFKYRKQFQILTHKNYQTLQQFKSSFHSLQSLINQPADQQAFHNKLFQKRKSYKHLFTINNFHTNIQPTTLNTFIFDIYNNIIQQQINKSEQVDLHFIEMITNQLKQRVNEYKQMNVFFLRNKNMINGIRRRFGMIEERISSNLFQDFTKYKNKTQNPDNLFGEINQVKKVKFKNDFTIKIKNNISLQNIEMLGNIINTFALYNIGSKKIYLLAELIFQTYYLKINSSSLNYYMSILAYSKRSIKSVQNNLSVLLHNNPQKQIYMINFLYYLAVNKIYLFECWNMLIKEINKKIKIEEQKQLGEQQIREYTRIYRIMRFMDENGQVQTFNKIELGRKRIWIQQRLRKYNELMSPQEREFKNYLQKQNYIYSIGQDGFELRRSYRLGKQEYIFFDLNNFLFKNEQNGDVVLLKEYYKNKNIRLKSINIHRVINAQTRRQMYQYYNSKLNKSQKLNIKKPLVYQF